MTDETKQDDAPVGGPTIGRRTLLKRAAIALPLVATIPSGAAATVARSSNYIGYRTTSDGSDARCLDAGSVREWETNPNLAHLYDDPWGQKIPKNYTYKRTRDVYNNAVNDSKNYSAAEACTKGGTFKVKNLNSKKIKVTRNNVMVSATALSSFGGDFPTRFFT